MDKAGRYSILIETILALGSGIAPSPRAAHGSCAVDSLQMVVYGGATGGKAHSCQNLQVAASPVMTSTYWI